jgi:hypothetical protein
VVVAVNSPALPPSEALGPAEPVLTTPPAVAPGKSGPDWNIIWGVVAGVLVLVLVLVVVYFIVERKRNQYINMSSQEMVHYAKENDLLAPNDANQLPLDSYSDSGEGGDAAKEKLDEIPIASTK